MRVFEYYSMLGCGHNACPRIRCAGSKASELARNAVRTFVRSYLTSVRIETVTMLPRRSVIGAMSVAKVVTTRLCSSTAAPQPPKSLPAKVLAFVSKNRQQIVNL